MDTKLMFSEAGIYHLHQLASLVHQHTGVRHKLSSAAGQLALLQTSASSTQSDIQSCCNQLAATLKPQQKLALEREGIFLDNSVGRQAS
ncbi:hypothetical protein [Gilvimarinus sp. DA14]|uniref:hypothetical protein n=1 Tax=Gilvimarinus sp. DA14 TaxID=2956798 RepID=UPI0020B7186D|nr:hypothetical protein [Gilvimarinus sp. DA14]UTF59181.1 hypothetical protein NHM04_11915 [Gilvimarinus sp. DA14]